MIIGEVKEHSEFYTEIMDKLLSKIKSLVEPYEEFLKNNFPNYFLSVKFENEFNKFYIDYRCVRKTILSLITDIIFNNNKFDRYKNTGGYIISCKIGVDDYKILISGMFYNYKNRKYIPFNCEVYIAKEKWTEDGSHYIGADVIKFKDMK